ncbi:MAG: DNA polymerase III subunit chi [Candidatus Rhabdochlamydia sp.]
MTITTKVLFYSVKTNQAKFEKIVEVATTHFEKKEPLFFLIPNLAAAAFLDQLLWNFPSESFLPHPTPLLQIGEQVLPDFPSVFNLCLVPLLKPVKLIHEFEDLFHPEKQLLSNNRYDLYKKSGYQVIMESLPA